MDSCSGIALKTLSVTVVSQWGACYTICSLIKIYFWDVSCSLVIIKVHRSKDLEEN